MSETRTLNRSLPDAAHAEIAEVLEILGTDGGGLSRTDVESRHRAFGANALPEPHRPGIRAIVLEEFRNPLFLVLAAAGGVAILVGERVDGAFILAALGATSVFGIAMAVRAERALVGLRHLLQPTARVVRDGRERELSAVDLVPGDRIVLARGMRIPADARLLDADALEVDESVLTGESLPVAKVVDGATGVLWQGTTVIEGAAIAVVTATGSRTKLAAIAAELTAPRTATPLQSALARFARVMTAVMLAFACLLFGIGLARGESPVAMLALSVAVAVAAIPEGLAVAVTATLAIGVVRLARQRCLVRRLVAAETLGAVSIILTDKTGTLTEGHMRVVGVRTPEGYVELPRERIRPSAQRCLRAVAVGTEAVVVNPDAPPDAWEFLGHSTEAALVAAAGTGGIDVRALRTSTPIVDRIPFSTDRKYSATLRAPDVQRAMGELILIGAPERIIAPGPLSPEVARELDERGSAGFRLVGVAVIDVPQAVTRIEDALAWVASFEALDAAERAARLPRLIGIFLMSDPLRPDAASALADARAAGVRTVMVTGDHPATATRIARDLGIGDRVCIGTELAALSDADLAVRIPNIDIFARTTPEQKLRLVRAWRHAGAVVAVTGDGVNDAPALVGADVGIAMGTGTDVAREASDLVLLDDRYATIVEGISGGRMMWDNLRKTTSYLLCSSFSEVVLIGGALALGIPIPVTPAQILWVNLVEDTLPAAALAFEPLERGAMSEPPRPRMMPLFGNDARILVFGVGLLGDLVLLGTAYALLRATGDLALTRTIMFGGLGINALLFVFGIRSIRQPIWRSRPLGNPWLLGAVAIALALLGIGLVHPALRGLLRTTAIPAWGWGIIVGFGCAELLAVEAVKAALRYVRGSRHA